ncbi:MAG: DUF4230 domain-containing protein [Erysipelotrichaceae bacterium]|nr:DUF4230 domain-containing protein [Erysipelotrichaceae bacterium]
MKSINWKKTLPVLALLAVIILGAIFIPEMIKKNQKEVNINTVSTLHKIIDVNELSTSECVYNGVVKVTDENNPEKIDYYISYEAKVKAGIDIDKVDITMDSENKVITITLPEIKINDIVVDETTFDYIFNNNRKDELGQTAVSLKLCKEDVVNEIENIDVVYDLARQNAVNIVKGLVSPFVESLRGYSLQIK